MQNIQLLCLWSVATDFIQLEVTLRDGHNISSKKSSNNPIRTDSDTLAVIIFQEYSFI